MKTIKFLILPAIFAGVFISCSDNGNDEPPVDSNGYEAPEAPSTVNQANLINIEFYSKLNDETLFSAQYDQAVVSHMTANKTPLAFIFDRSDAIVGQKSPVVDMARQCKLKSFFVQNNLSDNSIEGTGIIVRPLVPVFDGFGIPDTLYLAGCTIAAPLSQPVITTLMTCRLTASFQFPVIVRLLGDGLKTNRIVTGAIKATLVEEMKTYTKYHLKDFRLVFYTSAQGGCTYSIFYLTPVQFVVRETTGTTVGTIPMYQSKIEYLSD